jgi:hypothetical protein
LMSRRAEDSRRASCATLHETRSRYFRRSPSQPKARPEGEPVLGTNELPYHLVVRRRSGPDTERSTRTASAPGGSTPHRSASRKRPRRRRPPQDVSRRCADRSASNVAEESEFAGKDSIGACGRPARPPWGAPSESAPEGRLTDDARGSGRSALKW